MAPKGPPAILVCHNMSSPPFNIENRSFQAGQFLCNCEPMRVHQPVRRVQGSAQRVHNGAMRRGACKTAEAVRVAAHRLLRAVRVYSTARVAGEAGQWARAGGAMVAGACECNGRCWNCTRRRVVVEEGVVVLVDHAKDRCSIRDRCIGGSRRPICERSGAIWWCGGGMVPSRSGMVA